MARRVRGATPLGAVTDRPSSQTRRRYPFLENLSLSRALETAVVALFVCTALAVYAYRDRRHSVSAPTQRALVIDAETEQRSLFTEIAETLWRKITNKSETCATLAHRQTEPYTDRYRDQTIDLDGPVYAYHNWEGVTAKLEIEKHQIDLQKNASFGDCRLILKIYEGRLYVYERGYCYEQLRRNQHRRRYSAVWQLVMVAMEVYHLPNMDFVVALGDAADVHTDFDFPLPCLSFCVRYGSDATTGFTIPAFSAYWRALGDHQMEFYRECLRQRYPLEKRIRKAVWRGSTTGHVIIGVGDPMRNRRVRLVDIGSQMPDLFDVGFSSYVQMEGTSDVMRDFVRSHFPTSRRIRMEDFNRYKVVLDVDGNTWSERLTALLVGNTPVLKQRYGGWIEYFGHLLQDGVHVKFFDSDLSDLASIAAEMMDPDAFTLEDAEERVRNQFEFAKEHLSQLGVIRAMAYALLKMRSYTTWEVTMEEGAYHESWWREFTRGNRECLNPRSTSDLLQELRADLRS